MVWVLLFTATGVAAARHATLPVAFMAIAFAAAVLMALVTLRRRIGEAYIAAALLLLGMMLPALRPQPAYGPESDNRLHEAASERIRRLGLSPDAEALTLAMAAGDRTELTAERRAPYARTGTAHVLAVSGLHVGMVFLYVNLLLGGLALLHRGHLVRNAAAVVTIWLFAAAAGLSPGTIRAAVMFTALQLALATTSRYAGVNILATAAFGMLLWRPAYLHHAGFRLSFLSVAAILLWGVPLCRRLRTPWRAANALLGTLVMSAVAAAATAPARLVLLRADSAPRHSGQSARDPAHLRGGRGVAAMDGDAPATPFGRRAPGARRAAVAAKPAGRSGGHASVCRRRLPHDGGAGGGALSLFHDFHPRRIPSVAEKSVTLRR